MCQCEVLIIGDTRMRAVWVSKLVNLGLTTLDLVWGLACKGPLLGFGHDQVPYMDSDDLN